MSKLNTGTVEKVHEFRSKLLATLSKFNDNHTLKTGIDEVKKLMMNDITDTDRMNIFLNAL